MYNFQLNGLGSPTKEGDSPVSEKEYTFYDNFLEYHGTREIL